MRLDDRELETLLQDLESDRVERKESLSDKQKIRQAPCRATASLEEEKRLSEKSIAADLPYELQSVPSASIDDLDLVLFERGYLQAAVAPEVLEQNQRSMQDQLKAVRFVDRDGTPTVLGLLVVGKDPRAFIGGAYIQWVRFQGTGLADTIRNQKEIRGPLPDLIRRIDEVLDANIEVATSITEGPLEILVHHLVVRLLVVS
jgi:ATP-dependent DNA helicase RecG